MHALPGVQLLTRCIPAVCQLVYIEPGDAEKTLEFIGALALGHQSSNQVVGGSNPSGRARFSNVRSQDFGDTLAGCFFAKSRS
jgi:hypothetical protein